MVYTAFNMNDKLTALEKLRTSVNELRKSVNELKETTIKKFW